MEKKTSLLLLDQLNEGAYFVDPNRKIIYWNKKAEEITGYSAKEVVGSFCWDNLLKHVDSSGRRLCFTQCPLAATIKDGEEREAEVFLRHKEGFRLPVGVRCSQMMEGGEVTGGIELFRDISPKKRIERENKQLKQMSTMDRLTKIGNRRSLEQAMAIRTANMNREGRLFGMLFIDIDHFKQVNDKWGHEVGDNVLQIVASTLRNNSRGGEVVGRWGGEEFVVIVDLKDRDLGELASVAERIRMLVKNSSFKTDGKWGGVTISVGAAIVHPGETFEELMERCDKLMYTSKKKGRDRTTIEGEVEEAA